MRKYILIPEYRPLYAMQRCFGPTHGPLERPTLTPIDVIGTLLKQTGNERLTIFEVKKLDSGKFSEPVQLTQTNYMKSYDEIKENPVVPGQQLEEVKPPKAVHPVAPVKKTEPAPAAHDIKMELVMKPEPQVEQAPEKQEEPVEAHVEEASDADAHLQGETVVVVHPDEQPAAEDPADKSTESSEETGEADNDAAKAENETAASQVREGIELPDALPGEHPIQAGPYAGLTPSQKRALKAAGKTLK